MEEKLIGQDVGDGEGYDRAGQGACGEIGEAKLEKAQTVEQAKKEALEEFLNSEEYADKVWDATGDFYLYAFEQCNKQLADQNIKDVQVDVKPGMKMLLAHHGVPGQTLIIPSYAIYQQNPDWAYAKKEMGIDEEEEEEEEISSSDSEDKEQGKGEAGQGKVEDKVGDKSGQNGAGQGGGDQE